MTISEVRGDVAATAVVPHACDDAMAVKMTVNMAVKIRLRSANTSENSRGAPWN